MSDKMSFLRVLDLEGTKGLEDHHMKHIGKLLHLRYLSLRGCLGIRRLPKSVGNLSQLETLDIKYTLVQELPKTITKLTKLRYVHASVSWRHGVKLPRGIRKLKTLHTLRCVDLRLGNAVVQEIKCLTSLRKLVVWGMTKENGLELCSAISSSLSRLEYLSVKSYRVDLFDWFHDMSSPPENLQCLKLLGGMSKFPGWIKGLQNLVKLKVEGEELLWDGATMQGLGNLPNLSILTWLNKPTDVLESITFPSGLFRSLVVLELGYRTASVNFEPTAMPKLEVLKLIHSTGGFSGLESLPSIKEVILMEVEAKEDVAKQLARNQNRPILKLLV
uniref:Uncharacterized protein n=1 Tax=Avena sativa TaxID=4498 RepID=A0ACD5YVT1_AVESA